ncbi:hypothetical protein ACOBQX_12815 [Actinokineospora sp. G85]|uniref:hypothetical protein n=1 Tax=Actinokineospora sp. G85 TaxID=3406626 RepID=UPI003C720BCC
MTNPLVAEVKPLTSPEDGIAVYDFAVDAGRAISNGDWLEAGIDLGAAGLDALAFVADPFGTLLSSAFAWAMEHVDPLPDMLNKLAGNPDVVQANAATWGNVANALRTAGSEMTTIVNEDCAQWTGPAVWTYQPVALGEAKLIEAAAVAADAVGAAVSGAGIAVSVVRTTVRDLIADAMAEIVKWLGKAILATVVTVGLATPALVADVIRIVAKWSNKVADWLKKIVDTMKKLADLVKKVKPVLEKVKDTMEPIQKAAAARSLSLGQKVARNTGVTGGTYDDQAYATQ